MVMPGSYAFSCQEAASTPSCRGVVCSHCLLHVNAVNCGLSERDKRSVRRLPLPNFNHSTTSSWSKPSKRYAG